MSFPTLNGQRCQKKVRKWLRLGPAVGGLKFIFLFCFDNMVYFHFLMSFIFKDRAFDTPALK